MAKVRQGIFHIAVLALAFALAGCALDDSGPVRSVWRPANGKSAYINVVYVTDREPDAKAPGGFGTKWADKASCGTAEAIVPPATLPGQDPQYGYIAATKPAACAKGDRPLAGAVALIEAQAKAHHCRSVFLFLHGFHTGFDGAVLRAAQVGHDAQVGCAIAAFSWSSEVKLERYIPDLEHSEYSLPFLSELLRELSESGLRVTILAHSSGARLVLAVLSGYAHGRYPVRPDFIDELVLAAADVGSDKGNNDFAHLLADAVPYVKRTTIYASRMDGILLVSQYEHGGVPRAGEAPDVSLASSGAHVIDVIDASQPPADLLDHSYFAMSYETVADMSLALAGVPIEDRLAARDGAKPTLVCATKDGPCDGALAVATSRQPRLVSRMIITLLPLIPHVQ